MSTRITNSKLFKRLKEKRYRDRFVAGEVKRLIPFQLRALRASRKWTQAELGSEANMPQTVISRIENGNAASLSIKTLLKLASAFDVALVIRFEPIDRLVDFVDNLSPETMSPRSSSELLTEMESEAARTKQGQEQEPPNIPLKGVALLSEVASEQRQQKASSPAKLIANLPKAMGG